MQPAGLLQPVDVPTQVWADISMDFIEGLPKVAGKSVILTVVDRFSKYAHFIVLSHPYTAMTVARAFFDGIVRLHGFPLSIVSDWDPVFTGHVWRDLFEMAGVKLRMSTAFHPQMDGQSEVVNKVIAMYLRCVTGDRPQAWVDWLSWVEYCYNTSFHTALRATPFEVVYGRSPLPLLPYTPGTAREEAADAFFELGTRFWQRCASVCSRRSSCPKNTMMPATATSSSRWATGSGYGCSTARPSLWCRAQKGSSVPGMPDRSTSWSASTTSPTVFNFRRARVFMMSSTWACSSATVGIPVCSRRSCTNIRWPVGSSSGQGASCTSTSRLLAGAHPVARFS